MSITFEIQLVAIVVALACALPGVFLVLRRMALMSDAISHTVLLGIVLGFFVTGDVTSPALVLAAAGMGLLTVLLVEGVRATRLVAEDASIGIVFPALFRRFPDLALTVPEDELAWRRLSFVYGVEALPVSF